MASRSALFKQTIEALAKVHGKEPGRNPGDTPTDHLIYGVIVDNGPQQKARKAFQSLKEAFVDFNEMRVAAREEVIEPLKGIDSDPEEVARRADLVLRTLQGLFDAIDRVRLEFDREGAEGEVRLALGLIPDLSPGLVEAVIARALPEPPVRMNTDLSRVAQRVGLIPKSGGDTKHAAALAKMAGGGETRVLLHYLLTEHGEMWCLPRDPECEDCPCRDFCAYGKKKLADAPAKSKSKRKAS